jgi:HTH-type transcriptional regulator/antitoxin HipB
MTAMLRVMISNTDQLGQVLQGARKVAGLTQAEAAARLDISQSRISLMELNRAIGDAEIQKFEW